MRLIVPLQGILQKSGRGGLLLGSVIPCALFYFFQLYLKRRASTVRRRPPPSLPRSSSRPFLLSTSIPAPVSRRAAAFSSTAADSAYYAGLQHYLADPYHPSLNSDGIIQLGLAENRLSLDLIRVWIADNLDGLMDVYHDGITVNGLVAYQPFDGLMGLKIAISGFMGQVMPGSPSLDPSQMVLTSGATPAIETLTFCLADNGNAFLVPSPYYPGFDRDIKLRSGVELIPVPCRSAEQFFLSKDALDKAYCRAKRQGLKVRAVLVTNPSNPVGNLLNRENLCELLDFAIEKNIHIISDEVYAGSVYDKSEFVSFADVLDGYQLEKSRVHIVYGLSKDLCIPGFRVGVIYSYNENVLAAARKMARFSSISVPTQQLLVSMLSDQNFTTKFVKVNKERLLKMHSLFVEGLKQLGIDCADSCGGFYCWADMSKLLSSYSEEGELELWDRMLNVAKINATPGSSCHCIEPGWFRLCFTTLTEEEIPVVMGRIRSVINNCQA